MSSLYLFISITKSSITLSVTSAKVITSLAVKVEKKKPLSEFSVVKGDGVTDSLRDWSPFYLSHGTNSENASLSK